MDFVQRPLSATLLSVAAVLLVVAFLPAIKRSREKAFVESDA